MNINYFSDTETMSQKAAENVLEEIRQNPKSLLCTATGSSPKKLYQNLAQHAKLFEKTRIIPLDEWIGLSTPEGSCHAYIEEYVLNPLQIPVAHYFGFNADALHLEQECNRIQELLKREGPIDICILGLGKNGHLGFNEPAEELQAHCHIANLAAQSQEHNMIGSSSLKPTKGLTLGMQDILAAKKIILLVSGEGKELAKEQLLSGTITTDCPATWLWKHDNTECLILN
ncbi:galactosamine-6-phosphate isomerase [Maribacter algarum]|uniref:Galactosamine-6-phosphate isomerase n=1 Tax=Maribacter algarum (ex Zhang et al. 2020) TaxID=2578118 RepID=A0A5S3PR50_9FLAO|nr:galactosamine-6-phosphate isomerase [Maribacter algarum]TMM57141.1 galactosamine-6-phosphate isomerase [Maribacter algarum]